MMNKNMPFDEFPQQMFNLLRLFLRFKATNTVNL